MVAWGAASSRYRGEMDDEGPSLPDPPESEVDGEEDEKAPLPSLPPEVTTGDDELRRLIDAGASTPEELRELAARIREHREREDELWRGEVKPALRKAKKAPFRLGDMIDRPEEPRASIGWLFGLGVAGIAIVLVLAAAQSSVLWVLLPLAAVLVYSYRQGKRGDVVEESPPSSEAAPD